MQPKNVYFLSDAHLGAKVLTDNMERERKLVKFLNEIEGNCSDLYLLGDMFDFWFEYKYVVPKGFVRFLAKLAEFTEKGINVFFFTGNHDIWAFDYLEKECGVKVIKDIIETNINGKNFIIGHGDGLDPNDKKYLFLKKVFHNSFLQKSFRWIHPDMGIYIANAWSSHSRLKGNGEITAVEYRGDDREGIIQYCKNVLQKKDIDYFIFGHRHIPLNIELTEKSQYINTGDWITHFTYAVFDGQKVELKNY